MRGLRLLGVALVVAGCSDDDGSGPVAPEPSTVPEVVVTRPVGNPPVEGAVELAPRGMESGESPWRFEVDLDGDGEADASGEVTALRSVPFSFEAPGLHPVRVVFTRGTERAEVERSVNVLDPDRIEVLGTVQLEGAPLIEGIALDRSGTRLFVSRSFERLLVELDAMTLTVLDTLHVPEVTNTLEGLAVAPDEELLYVVSKFPFASLWLIDLDRFETEAFFKDLSTGEYYVEALPGRRVYTSGSEDLGLIDARDGTVVAELELAVSEEANHFAISPSGDRIVVILDNNTGPPFHWSVVLVDMELNEIRRSERVDVFLEHVAWSPNRDRIYVRYVDEPLGDRCGVFVLDPMTLEVLKNVPLSVDQGNCSAASVAVANPVDATPDGRFLLLPSAAGTFVFDTLVDRPIASFPICCNVAASPSEDVFYVVTFDGDVTRLRFLRGD